MVSLINGLIIYSSIVRKSTLDFHKRIDEKEMHQYVEPLQPNVPEKNIDYNDRINQWVIDDDIDFEWIQ